MVLGGSILNSLILSPLHCTITQGDWGWLNASVYIHHATHTYIHMYMYILDAHTHTCADTHTHIHIHTYIHTYIHTVYMHTQTFSLFASVSGGFLVCEGTGAHAALEWMVCVFSGSPTRARYSALTRCRVDRICRQRKASQAGGVSSSDYPVRVS